MSGITVLSIGLNENFLLNAPSLTNFSGALNGNSCSGALLVKKDSTAGGATPNSAMNIIECKLTTPIASFATGAVMEVTLSGVTNPTIPGRYPLGAKLKTSAWDEFFYGETLIKDNNDSTSPTLV